MTNKKNVLINQQSVTDLLRGASLLACGGGLALPEQQRLIGQGKLKAALKVGISILAIDELADEDLLVTVSEVGAASAPVMSKVALPEALALLERTLQVKVKALIPGEIGQEAIILEAAAVTGLPLVNSDLSGCRAVPRLTDLALVVQGVPFQFSPAVVMTRRGKATYIDKQPSLAADEELIRSLVPKDDIVTLVGGCITGKTIKKYLAYDSLTRAIAVGKSLVKGDLENQLPNTISFTPRLVKVTQIKEKDAAGFNVKSITLKDESDGFTYQLTVENEYMVLQTSQKKFAFPDLIMLYDQKKQVGLHSSQLQLGTTATLLVMEAFDFWKEKGKEIV